MASESRDGFGWEYYVGRYDGLGRRRRRWVRTLKRVSTIIPSSSSGSSVAMATTNADTTAASGGGKKSSFMDAKKKQSSKTLAKKPKVSTSRQRASIYTIIKDQYNFKGFGWSFYKSLLLAKSFGAAFRIPLSANFDSYDKYLAAPYISTSTFVGYPWVIATFLNASLPLDAIKWAIGGVLWKIQWALAVVSAFVRGVIEAVIFIVLWPWRLWRTSLEMLAMLVSRLRIGPTKSVVEAEASQTLFDGADKVAEKDATMNVTIETHIEMNNSSEFSVDNVGEVSATTAVVDSPRGGASTTNNAQVSTTTTKSSQKKKDKIKKKHLTLLGNEVPSFHRSNSIEYSTTIQERLGMCISWRVSQQRGYEFRWHFFYTCLPTVLFWNQIEEERKKRLDSVRRRLWGVWNARKNDPSSAKFVGTIEADKIDDRDKEPKPPSKSSSRSNKDSQSHFLSSFLSDHSSTVGMSSGFPLPVDPYFSLSLMLSLSGFYYGWLLKYIRSLFVLPLPQSRPTRVSPSRQKERYYNDLLNSISDDEATTMSESDDKLSTNSEKLVSSALKKKLTLEEAEENLAELTDDETSSIATSSTQMDFSDSDTEDCLENSTATELNVAGL